MAWLSLSHSDFAPCFPEARTALDEVRGRGLMVNGAIRVQKEMPQACFKKTEFCFCENRVLFFLPRQQSVKCLRENSKVFAGKQLADWVYPVSELGVPDRRIVCTRLGDWQQPINPMSSQNRILVKVK